MNRLIAVVAIAVAALFFVIPARAQSAPVITLTNGPPNIPYTAPGSCTYSTCTWIQAGVSGEAVSDVYLDMVPMSQNYTGTFTLSGPNASNYSISTSSDGVRNVGHIITASALSAGDDDVTVSAGSVSQRITVHKVSGTVVNCSGDITSALQSAINSGGTALVGSGTCTVSSKLSTSSNMAIIGYGRDQTIIDGNAGGSFLDAYNGGVSNPNQNGTIRNITIQNFGKSGQGCDSSFGQPWAFQTGGGWVVANTTIQNNGGTGIQDWTDGGSTWFLNNRVLSNGYSGASGGFLNNPTSVAQYFIGNEVSGSNVACNASTQNNVASVGKLGSSGSNNTVWVKNNYIHNNNSMAIWCDFCSTTSVNYVGNTVFNNYSTSNDIAAIQTEISNGTQNCSPCFTDVSFNAVVNAHNDGIFESSSDNVAIHDNNVLVNGGADAISVFMDWGRVPSGDSNHLPVWHNTVTFANSGGWTGYFWGGTQGTNGNGTCASGSESASSPTCSNDNTFYVQSGNTGEAHWLWNQGNYNTTPATWTSYRSSTGQDANSQLLTGGAGIASGCTHVACSGSGIGPGGVPIAAPSGPSIQSIALSNSTFTPNVANGVVGTVAVTMSNGSAFSGTNSITGTNSGGFHLSGNTLEEKASSGTPASTYKDFNIVATQSTASNSPQQISPTVSGAAEAPFGGTPRSVTGRIQAEDFDTGGYGVAYHATNACGIGIDTAYGPDRLNVTPTADLDGEDNLKVGCNQPGDWHNYTITVPTTGVYTLSMRVANIETGAAYHVAIDGTTAVSGIAVPNTGGYDTFATVTSGQFSLTAGQHVIQIGLDTVGPSGFGGDFNWMQASAVLSMQSIALSNSTFTPNVANGAVGTVAVTMSNGSAFTGTLSITGTNSGGFHLSGNTLEEKASSGTPAGTYNDFNIVATQSTASNSPQQISPTVSGAGEAPFGGTPRSISIQIQAEDFDTGGYGVAYHATNACGIGIDTAYGPDRLNVTPTADLDGEDNLKVGCNQPGDWHNYTITVPTTGVYTLSMRVANIETGATYHVAIDGTNMVSGIAVPNTGGYDTFTTVTSGQFHVTAGQHIMQIVLDTAGPSGFGGDFNWMNGTFVAACPT